MTETAPLLGVRATARKLGVHENTVRNWCARGILQPQIAPGGRRKFRPADVELLAARMGGGLELVRDIDVYVALALVTTAAQILDEAAARLAGEPEAEAIAVATSAAAYARNALEQGMRP